MSAVPLVPLTGGGHIPQLGFGVFQIKPEHTVAAVATAFADGYRHIDTAQMYGNEQQVGQAVAQSGLDRDELFITTKVNNNRQSRDEILGSIKASNTALRLEQADLFLIHWPLPTVRDYVAAWQAMETALAEGLTRSIGVSNFQQAHLQRLLDETETVPAVNQIEAHPYLTQDALRAFGESNGIATEAWSPIAQGAVLNDPVIGGIADRLGRSPAQITLRWHLQLGSIVFPKSVTPQRIADNIAPFDFELTPEEMSSISALNRDERTGPDPDTFAYVP